MKKNGCMRLFLIFAVVFLLALAVTPVSAETVGVYNESSSFDELKAIIAESNENKETPYTIVIMEDIAVTGELAIKGNITLTTGSTHSNKLTFNAGADVVRMFNVTDSGKLTIRDNNSQLLTLQGSSGTKATLVYVRSGSQFLLENGTLTGSTSDSASAVQVYGGTFVMNGGTISGNAITMSGGAVYIMNEGTFEMSGGSISGNSCCAVYVSNQKGGGILHLSGGTISGNSIGVYFMSGEFFLAGSPQISENSNYDIYVGTNQYITLSDFNPVGEGKIVIRCSEYSSPKVFARGTEPAEDISEYKSFFTSADSRYFVIYDEENNALCLSLPMVNEPKQSSVWISAPSNSKLGSGILDNPNGGTVNFPEGFPFKSVTINQAGEVTQTSPSSAESTFPVSDKRLILASADITTTPALPSNGTGTVTIEFTVPADKIPQGHAVGVYHRVASVSTTSSSEMISQNAMAEAKKVIEETSAVINEVNRVLEKYSNLGAIPSSALLNAYYEVMDAAKKAKEASQKAGDAERNVLLDDRETQDEAHKASKDAQEAAFVAERLAGDIAEKLGYTPPERAEGSDSGVWKAEKVIEIGRSDGLVHYAVEVNSLSPFVIVVEQGGAEPAKEYEPDYAPPLDHEPITATPAESPAPLLPVVAGLLAGFVVLRRR